MLQFDQDKDDTLDFQEFLNLCSKLISYKISQPVSLSVPIKNGMMICETINFCKKPIPILFSQEDRLGRVQKDETIARRAI